MLSQRKSRVDVEGLGLDALISVAVATRPDDVFLCDPLLRESWSGVGNHDLSYRDIDQRARRLASLLSLSRLPERAQALIIAPAGSEQLIAMLAAMRAGLRPFLLPLSAGQPELQGWLDAAGPSIGIATTRFGELAPARMLRDAAARSFNARLVCAFGPDTPDGVVPLDSVLVSTVSLPELPALSNPPGTLPFAAQTSDGERQSLRETDLVAAAVDIARCGHLGGHSRVLSLMTSPSFLGLAAGPYLALLTGAEYLPLGLFSQSALFDALRGGRATTLVAPASIEPALRKAGILGHPDITLVAFLHRHGLPEQVQPDGSTIIDLAVSEGAGLSVRHR